MRTIEIKEIELISGSEYVPDSYPSKGLYHNLNDDNIYCVLAPLELAMWVTLVGPFMDIIKDDQCAEKEPTESKLGFVSEDFILKFSEIIISK